MTWAASPALRSKVQPPQPNAVDDGDQERHRLGHGGMRPEHVGQGGADDQDRLTQRDQDERLAAFREVISLDGPLGRFRAAQPWRVEAEHAAEEVDADRGHPEPGPGRSGGKPAGNRQRPADDAPRQDALEVPLQRPPAQRHHREDAAADLRERVPDADDQPTGAERFRYRRPHHQRDQEQGKQQPADRQPLRVEPVGHPRGVNPQQPHHGQQQRRLQCPGDRGPPEQVPRQLGDREDVDQIEEQLGVGDPFGTRRRRIRLSCAPLVIPVVATAR
jgi:hypothetical protein